MPVPPLDGSVELRTVTAADVVPEHVEWLDCNRLPRGKLVLLDGDPGQGKSVLSCEWAARLSCGEPLTPGAAPPAAGNTLMLAVEDDWADTVRARLDAARADVERIHLSRDVADKAGARSIDIGQRADLAALEQRIRDAEITLVILDPLDTFFAIAGATSPAKQRRVLQGLGALARETKATVLAVRHLTKATTSALLGGAGSIGVVGTARLALVVGRDPDAPDDDEARVLAVSKSNIAAKAPSLRFTIGAGPTIVWRGESTRSADALMDLRRGWGSGGAVEEAQRFLSEYLASGDMTPTNVRAAAKALGIKEATLRRAKTALGITYNRGLWHLPEKHQEVDQGDQPDQPDRGGEVIDFMAAKRLLLGAGPSRHQDDEAISLQEADVGHDDLEPGDE